MVGQAGIGGKRLDAILEQQKLNMAWESCLLVVLLCLDGILGYDQT
jgi:hypothetical protein